MEEIQRLFTKEEEEELIPLLNEGKVILFLGVGFSVNAKNIIGNNIPTGTNFAKFMNFAIRSKGKLGFDLDNPGNLKIVSESFFEVFKNETTYINSFFRQHLTVDKNSIPEKYNNLKSVKWNSIYTTNYDNLLEAIYDDPTSFHKAVYKKTNTIMPFDDQFNISYLNGDLEINARVDSNFNGLVTDVICSTSDYASNYPSLIWNDFMNKFRQNPILILGSQLEEDSFYSYINILNAGAKIDFSNRPKSYLINIDSDNENFNTKESKYNLVHKKADANKFLDWILSITELAHTNQHILVEKPLTTNKISSNYIEFTKEYWDNLKGKNSKENLIKYYTNINSSPLLLPYVVADQFYIEPTEEIVIKSVSSRQESVRVELNSKFPKKTGNHNCIVWINANGGTGKSTLLLHIGKKYCEKYHILFFKEITETTPILPLFSNDNIPVIILLDNYGKQLEKLNFLSQALNEIYYKRGYSIIAAEKHFRYSALDKELKKEVEENFLDFVDATFNHSYVFYEKIFDKIIQLIDNENKLTVKKKDSLKARFAINSKATTAERIIEFLISVKHSNLGFQFRFDWEDWEKLCKGNSDLNIYYNLYSIVAAFNKYEITPPIKFCVELLGINDPNLISTYSLFSEPDYDFPISIYKNKCFELRNPNLGEWYIKEKDHLGILTKKYFQEALGDCKSHEQIYFLRNIYRNNKVWKDEELKILIPTREILLNCFKNYIFSNPLDTDNIKNKMELVVINYQSGNSIEAKKILYEMIADSPQEIHARSKLASILMQEQNYDEAAPLVSFLAKAEPTNNYVIKFTIELLIHSESFLKHSTVESNILKELISTLIMKDNIASLKYLYAKLAKALRISDNLLEAEEYCNKLLKLNPLDFYAMNTLAMIYQKQDKLEEAKELLLKAIEIQPNNPHNYNELGQVYTQFYDKTHNVDFKYQAFDVFLKGLRRDNENIPLRTSFARFLISYCNKRTCAKNILLYNLQKDPNNFHSYVELGMLYFNQQLFVEAKEILEKGKENILNGEVEQKHIPIFVILGKVYLELNEYDKAEELFKKTIEIKPENWISHLEIAIAFLKQKKSIEFENEFDKILNGLNDINLLCDFAYLLKNNDRIDESRIIISKAKSINGNK